ncbi:MAG: hypothetical protein KC519_17435, partial [Anaerolineae bacterium]|nr:hypothetical protein [Anaerolineae bacterium]
MTFEQYPALLITKLYVPRVREATVSRERLFAQLEAGRARKLILVAAAAGSGKTTVVAEWCSQHANDACWVSLDEGDNDP